MAKWSIRGEIFDNIDSNQSEPNQTSVSKNQMREQRSMWPSLSRKGIKGNPDSTEQGQKAEGANGRNHNPHSPAQPAE